MVVDFFFIQFMDFNGDDGQRVNLIKAWYLEDSVNTDFSVGRRPQFKYIPVEYKDVLKTGGVGRYDVSINLSGRVNAVKKV